jgi:chemotaxis protein MotB
MRNKLRMRNLRNLTASVCTKFNPINALPAFSSNWELSTARSTEMIGLLVVKYGLDPQRLSASGYGEYHPIASNSTEVGRALNRRVDLVVVGKQQPGSSPDREQEKR